MHTLDQNQYLVPNLKDMMYVCLYLKVHGHGMTFKVHNLGSNYYDSAHE